MNLFLSFLEESIYFLLRLSCENFLLVILLEGVIIRQLLVHSIFCQQTQDVSELFLLLFQGLLIPNVLVETYLLRIYFIFSFVISPLSTIIRFVVKDL